MNKSFKGSPVAQQLWFTSAQSVDIRAHQLPELGDGEFLVAVHFSAISAGTEMLVYRGQVPNEMSLDESIAALQTQVSFPLQYGYAAVGIVERVGAQVDAAWLGKRVFAFQPHASHFIAQAHNLIEIPADISSEAALFLPNMETAVNLIQDGAPALGERVVVLGQGIVGLLLTALLAQYPLAQLHALDNIPQRRSRALQLGATSVGDPCSQDAINLVHRQLQMGVAQHAENIVGADLIYEVSGAPEALNLAIDLSGFTSRIVIGSWYGTKSAAIALGAVAHRNRLHIITSQVSSIAPQLTGRWNKTRRFDVVWEMIRRVKPEQLISHSSAIADAAAIYAQLDQSPQDVLQAIITYSH
jgi:2-desacetyl-2-hydroxyethyl bacteriochlorophyllide A dehydrogenase